MNEKAVRSTKKQIKKSLRTSRYFTKNSLTPKEQKILKQIKTKKIDSKKLFSKKGKYTSSRLKIHKKIMNKYLRQDKRTRKPDIYIFGGVAGSGKTTTLKKYVKEKTMVVNNDDIKKDLTKYNPSPIKRFPLIHARFLHEEASDIEKKLLTKAIVGKKDIILDKTLGNLIKMRALVSKVKKKGYRITVLGTNLPPHIAMIRVTSRFLQSGRYVPLKRIAKTGNKTNSNVLKLAKNKNVSRAKVFTVKRGKPILMYSKRRR